MNSYTQGWSLLIVIIGLLFFATSQTTIAQSIALPVLAEKESFEGVSASSWSNPYVSSMPLCEDVGSHVWSTTNLITDGMNSLDVATDGVMFWGAQRTDEASCGNNAGTGAINAIEQIFFPDISLPSSAKMAEICFDYYAQNLSTFDDFLSMRLSLNGTLQDSINVIAGAINGGVTSTNAWISYCETICLDTLSSSQVGLQLKTSAFGKDGWIAIDNIRLYYSQLISPKDTACFPYVNNTSEDDCLYYLILEDSNPNNSWGQASIDISIDNGATNNYTINTSEEYAIFPLVVNDASVITYTYNGGTSDSENNFYFLDKNGQNAILPNLPLQNGWSDSFISSCSPICTEEEIPFVLRVNPGSAPTEVSWEIRDSDGVRIAFVNGGGYTTSTIQQHEIELDACEEYTLSVYDGDLDGWMDGYWELLYKSGDNAYGWEVINDTSTDFILLSGDGESFTKEARYTIKIPCTPICAEPTTIEALSNCEINNFIPNLPEITSCPGSCSNASSILATIPSLDTTINLSYTNGVTLEVGTHDIIYEVILNDGMLVRCTSEVMVVVELNPTVVCNDQVTISLGNTDACTVTVSPDDLIENFIPCSDEYEVAIYFVDGTFVGDEVDDSHIGEDLFYTVTHIQSGNYCWGFLTVEDKIAPIITCSVQDTLPCNHPSVVTPLTEWTQTFTALGDANELPANIAGGAAGNPSVKRIPIYATGTNAALGEIVKNIEVELQATHSDIEDLMVYLEAPNGQQVTLLNRPCVNTDQRNISAFFNDDGNAIICNSTSNFALSGSIIPAEDDGTAAKGLSKFKGLPTTDMEGTWYITIEDHDDTVGGDDQEVGIGEVTNVNVRITAGLRPNYVVSDCSDYNLSMLNESYFTTDCDASVGGYIQRIFQAEDIHGNISTCEQIVYLMSPNFSDLTLPDTLEVACSVSLDTSATALGVPLFNGQSITEEEHIFCNVTYTYEDQLFPACGNAFDLYRHWTLIDWCSGQSFQYVQLINVIDKTRPSISPGEVIIIPDSMACEADVDLAAVVKDECSDIIQITATYEIPGGAHPNGTIQVSQDITNNTILNDLPIGTFNVALFAIDACGNSTTQTVDIDVVDQIPPVALCADTTLTPSPLVVSVGTDSLAKLIVAQIEWGSYDICGIEDYAIRRVDGCLGTSDWGQEVELSCCDQAFNPIIVELRVRDAAGNHSICSKEVIVEDAIPPVITCQDTLFLECIDEITALDAFEDPILEDNCNGNLKLDFITTGFISPQCNNGTLTRTWTASDNSDKSADAVCSQTIVVRHLSNFDVIFPSDTLVADCPEEIGDAGAPIFINEDCELLAVSHEDVVLTVIPDACYKIERTWKVINWCVYNAPTGSGYIIDPSSNNGYYEATQTIKVIDNNPPEIDCPINLSHFCNETNDCELEVDLSIEAKDACSSIEDLQYFYEIDIDIDGTIDFSGSTNIVLLSLPQGTHQIKWKVEDGCGNTNTCTYDFTIEDCKAPTPICVNGLSIETSNTIDGCVEIDAASFLQYSTDNCSDASFLENSVKIREAGDTNSPQSKLTFCCEDVGVAIIEVWITDEAGNESFCTTYLVVEDNQNNCTNIVGDVAIAGVIQTHYGENIQNVNVGLDNGTSNALPTGVSGYYVFSNLAENNNYEIRPSKNHDTSNGLTTYDIVLMSQHILAIETIDDPYQLIAADVNGDGKVSTFDITQLRKLILGITTDFPSNTSWRFIDANYVFPMNNNPWFETFPEAINFSNLNTHELNSDFIGIKIGDVNGSARPDL